MARARTTTAERGHDDPATPPPGSVPPVVVPPVVVPPVVAPPVVVPPVVVLVDADTLAGWRRSSPSLGQLHQAILHLVAQHRDVPIAVLADPALKHQLPVAEQEDFDADVASGLVVCSPAGAVEGTEGFFAAVTARAERDGKQVVVVTDRSYPFGRLVPLRRDGRRWLFDLDGAAPAPAGTSGAAPAARTRRRRR